MQAEISLLTPPRQTSGMDNTIIAIDVSHSVLRIKKATLNGSLFEVLKTPTQNWASEVPQALGLRSIRNFSVDRSGV